MDGYIARTKSGKMLRKWLDEDGYSRSQFISEKTARIPEAKATVDTVNKAAKPVKKTLNRTTKRIRNRKYKSPRSAISVVFGGWGR